MAAWGTRQGQTELGVGMQASAESDGPFGLGLALGHEGRVHLGNHLVGHQASSPDAPGWAIIPLYGVSGPDGDFGHPVGVAPIPRAPDAVGDAARAP